MTTYALPTWFVPVTAEVQWVPETRSFASPYGGATQSLDLLGGRWRIAVQLPGCKRADAAAREAWLNRLQGSVHRVSMHHLVRPYPRGSARGTVTLSAAASQGASSLALTGLRGGQNLLRSAREYTVYTSASWGVLNSVVTGGVADPVGGTAAFSIASAAAGDFYAIRTHTTTAHAGRNAAFSVWLKSGTYTGNVNLRVRDGAYAVLGSAVVTITSTWTLFVVAANCGASPAANLLLDIDPATNAAGAGEVLYAYQPVIELSEFEVSNCTVKPKELTDPINSFRGMQMLRTATGNHYLRWVYTTTAHASGTYTFSVWIKSGTLTGNVVLRLRDGAENEIATTTLTPTASWVRYSVTGTFGASPAADIKVVVDPANDTGSAGDTLGVYGGMLERGSAVTEHTQLPTLLAGDMLGVGGQLFMVAEDATADDTGAATVQLVNRSRAALSSAASVTWSKPTAEFMLSALQGVPTLYQPGLAPGHALEFTEGWSS